MAEDSAFPVKSLVIQWLLVCGWFVAYSGCSLETLPVAPRTSGSSE
jgi:hypothetical protein